MILQETRTEAAASSLEGLRGWLVLVGIAFCLAPLRILKDMLGNAQAFEADTWEMLTTPGNPAYHPLWAPVLIGEMVVNVALLTVSVAAVYLFFKRRRVFPRLAIGLLAAGVVVLVLDVMVVRMIPAAAGAIGASEIRGLVQAAIGALIWIPYFLVSARVRATFVR